MTINRQSGDYTPSNFSTNTTKWQTESAAGLAPDSSKMDGEFNHAYDVLNEHETRLTAVEAATEELPDQYGNSGKYLTTNGTAPSWSSLTNLDADTLLADNTVGMDKISRTGSSTYPLFSGGADANPSFRAIAQTDLPMMVFNHAQVFDANGSFTPSYNVTKVFVEVWGSGAPGGGAVTGSYCCGGGGGAGGYACGFVDVTPMTPEGVGTPHTVTVGAAVAGGTGSGSNGNASSFAGATTTITASGGTGGTGATSSSAAPVQGGPGGSGSGTGAITITGQSGEASSVNSSSPAFPGGGGGSAPRGGAGGRVTGSYQTNGNGSDGIAPGGGGGGGYRYNSNASGGAGAHGRVIVYYP